MKLKTIAKNLLLEQSRAKSISEDECIKIIQTKCKRFDPVKHMVLYRGKNSDDPYTFVDPSKFNRKSSNTKNYYTLIIDNSPDWRQFPARSKSLICTNDSGTPWSYGFPHVIIPFDGATLGMAPRGDIWYSFPDLSKALGQPKIQLHDFNQLLTDLYRESVGEQLSEDSYSNLIADLERLSELKELDREALETLGSSRGLSLFAFAMAFKESRFDSFPQFINDLLKPVGFDIAKQPASRQSSDREIWTDSPSVMIHYRSVENVFNKLYPNFDVDNLRL